VSGDTCDYAEDIAGVIVTCINPVAVDIRWEWRVPMDHPTSGGLCELHFVRGSQQIADDPDIVYESIQVRRRQ